MKPSWVSLPWACALLIINAAAGCSSPTDAPAGSVLLDRQIVADVFGDHNGVASTDELSALGAFFAVNHEAWAVSNLPERLWMSNETTPDEVKACFGAVAAHPYASEQSLRHTFEGINIKTPYVSVVVLSSGQQIHVTKLFRSPGPGISSARWDILNVK
jgi:hypothetical protein